MSKRVKILVSVLMVVVLLTVGGVATVLADEESSPEPVQQTEQELNQALIVALTNAVEQGLITQQQADKIMQRWHQTGQIRRQFVARRMIGMTEEELDAALAEQVAAGRITEQQAAKIKEQWQQHRGQVRRQFVARRMMGMSKEELDAALAEQVAAGRITEQQAAKIKEQWQHAKERLEQGARGWGPGGWRHGGWAQEE